MRQRHRRVALSGAHMRFANTAAEVVNMSRTGALIRLGRKQRVGGEWPLVLELPAGGELWLNGRVVRWERERSSGTASTSATNQYLLGLTFVQPSEDALAVLDEVAGTEGPTPIENIPPLRLWSTRASRRVRRLSVSLQRRCPECGSREVRKEARHHYSCDHCGCQFAGFHIGAIRLAF